MKTQRSTGQAENLSLRTKGLGQLKYQSEFQSEPISKSYDSHEFVNIYLKEMHGIASIFIKSRCGTLMARFNAVFL